MSACASGGCGKKGSLRLAGRLRFCYTTTLLYLCASVPMADRGERAEYVLSPLQQIYGIGLSSCVNEEQDYGLLSGVGRTLFWIKSRLGGRARRLLLVQWFPYLQVGREEYIGCYAR